MSDYEGAGQDPEFTDPTRPDRRDHWLLDEPTRLEVEMDER